VNGLDGRSEPLVTIRIVGLPLALRARAAEHAEELRREFALLAGQAERDESSVPHRLVELTRALRGRYTAFTAEQEDEMDAALAAGRAGVDLTFRVPRHVAEAARAFGDLMDEADDYCREGRHLLTLATPPDLIAYRRWFLGQFIDQSAGALPRPWPAARAAQPG
jgi:hypothetical protein